MEVNRIIELDADTSREGDDNFLYIRYIHETSRKRSRQPDITRDVQQDIFVITHALVSLILEGEQSGQFEKGSLMNASMNDLMALYVDVNMEVEGQVTLPEKFIRKVGREHGL